MARTRAMGACPRAAGTAPSRHCHVTTMAPAADGLRTPDDWFALGEAIFAEVVALLARYGVELDPALRFERSEAPTPSYRPSTRTIRFGIPDPTTPKGRLYWYFVQHLVGAPDLPAVQRAMELPLPWAVAHEVAHHLRHHYGAPVDNDFVEEQVANCLAIALLEDHPTYRHGLPDLQRWAATVCERTRAFSPDTVAYLAGDRLEVGEVLVAQGVVERSTLEDAKDFADATGSPIEDVLLRLKTVSSAELARARVEQHRSETYFNRRYMASLGEYWLFGTEWLAAYLGRDTRPSLGEALERYVLTADWEASRRDATRLLLEQALRGADAQVAAAAAEGLAEVAGDSAVPALVSALADPRPAVQLAALRILGALPGGPAAGAVRTRALLAGPDGVRGAAARLLRLAGAAFVLPPDADPTQQAERALASLSDDPAAACQQLGRLLDGDEPSKLAALEALREAGPGPLAGRVTAHLDAPSERVRAAAARVLGRCSEAGPALVRRLNDDDAEVCLEARDALRTLGAAAGPALLGIAPSAPERLRLEALCLAVDLGLATATSLLDELAGALLMRASRLARLETRLLAHPSLALLAQAAGEERGRLARLSLRAFAQAADPRLWDLAERALDSPDPVHRAAGRRLLGYGLGRGGPARVKLLDPGAPGARASSVERALGAAIEAEPAIVRAVAAYLVPQLASPTRARRWLRRLAEDPDRLVRTEAEWAAARPASPIGAPMLTTVEKLMFLRAIPTFAAADLETLRAAAELLVAQHFAAGEAIVVEGEPGEHLYVVTDGRVAVSVGGRPLHDLGPRQYFGEMALFDGQSRSATVTAAEDTTVLRLDRTDFVRLGRQCPDLLIEVIRVLSGRLRGALATGPAEHPDDDPGVPTVQGTGA